MNNKGTEGERIAAEYMQSKGFELLASNYTSRFGEIDLIVTDCEYIVFVEVKQRSRTDFGTGLEAVTKSKQRKLRTTAMIWLQKNQAEKQPRFDVIEIGKLSKDVPYKINHIENAF